MRGRILLNQKKINLSGSLLLVALMAFFSCSKNSGSSSKSRSSNSLAKQYQAARVLEDNPLIYNAAFAVGDNFVPYLSKNAKPITSSSLLDGNCNFSTGTLSTTINNCFMVYGVSTSTARIQSADGNWQFHPGLQPEYFWQVNSYYHVKKSLSFFMNGLSFAYNSLYNYGSPTAPLNTSLPPITPYNLLLNQNNWFTYTLNANTSSTGWTSVPLYVLATSELEKNASFSAALTQLSLGRDSRYPGFYFAQDPTVIYHELGHSFVKIMMNLRNTYTHRTTTLQRTTLTKSDLGTQFYDEAGAINEGLADYFSYLLNGGRAHFGEWGVGKLYSQSRPMSESDALHAGRVAEDEEHRLRYPEFVLYDPNYPDQGIEDIHYAGQITSHYLVALSKSLKATCSIDHEVLGNWMILLLSETLGEMGDLTGQMTDYYKNGLSTNAYTNLIQNSETIAYHWAHVVKPPTYRKFYQTLAKNIYAHVTSNLCPSFTKLMSEELLDEYGLLLFKGYRVPAVSTTSSASTSASFDRVLSNTSQTSAISSAAMTVSFSAMTPTVIDSAYPQKSMRTTKNKLSLPATTDSRPDAYIIDGKSAIENFIQTLQNSGFADASPSVPNLASPDYNNNNAKISPGEVVGIALNLVNNSNSIMGGVQVLANSWDHMRTGTVSITQSGSIVPITSVNFGSAYQATAPCMMGSNAFPAEDSGGAIEAINGVDTSTQAGGCNYVTRNNAQFTTSSGLASDFASPICFVQYSDENKTTWLSQSIFVKQINGWKTSDCLNSNSSSTFNPNECLIRVIPAAQQAMYSKIDPGKTWYETILAAGNKSVTFNYSGIILMEVNKKIPIGTLFNCRFRTRFTNCSDCYEKSNGDEYLDYEYAGPDPYQIINLQFRVID